jgi:hypothetical protein
VSINKAFVVKNSFEVSTDLVLANADTRRVGVGSTNPQYQFPVIPNNAVGPTGNVTINTVGTTANAAYTVIIELHKNNQYYSSGQFTDPAAFNYPPFGVTP